MSGGITNVDLTQLHHHAMHVDDVAIGMDAPIGAARAVTPGAWDFSYGITCQFFAVAVRFAASEATSVMSAVRQSLGGAAEQLHASAGEYRDSERGRRMLLESVARQESDAAAAVRGAGDLVDRSAKFDRGQYGVDWHEVGDGDYSSFNPISSGAGHNWFSGLGIYEDAAEAVQEAMKGKDANAALIAADTPAVAFDLMGAAEDPFGAIGQMAAGWLMEHLKPLRLMLDGLAGNPDMVKGAETSWLNISGRLDELANGYRGNVTTDTAHWHGEAADAYRTRTANKLANATATTALLAKGMGILVGAAAEVVDATRSNVRDLIAYLCGELLKAGLKDLGISVPTEALGQIARTTRLAETMIGRMLHSLNEFADLISGLLTVYQAVAKILPHLKG
jgi:hypothetical protein